MKSLFFALAILPFFMGANAEQTKLDAERELFARGFKIAQVAECKRIADQIHMAKKISKAPAATYAEKRAKWLAKNSIPELEQRLTDIETGKVWPPMMLDPNHLEAGQVGKLITEIQPPADHPPVKIYYVIKHAKSDWVSVVAYWKWKTKKGKKTTIHKRVSKPFYIRETPGGVVERCVEPVKWYRVTLENGRFHLWPFTYVR